MRDGQVSALVLVVMRSKHVSLGAASSKLCPATLLIVILYCVWYVFTCLTYSGFHAAADPSCLNPVDLHLAVTLCTSPPHVNIRDEAYVLPLCL